MRLSNLVPRAIGGWDLSHDKDGNSLYRRFRPAERYVVDFADDFSTEGWKQYDTDQDAHYFGCWVNPRQFLVLTYAEGDWTLQVCLDADHYNAQIDRMNEFYSEGYEAKVIDTEKRTCTEYRQDRQTFYAEVPK